VTANDLPERYRCRGAADWAVSGVRIVPPLAAAPDSRDFAATVARSEETLGSLEILETLEAIDAAPRGAVDLKAAFDLKDGIDLKDHLSAIEIGLIRQAMQEADGTVAEAARLLKIRRTTLVEKLRKYRLSA
jgi:sigma-54 specific flagellar transcriptional regulator A